MVANAQVQDAETAIMHEITDLTTAESAGGTTRTTETTLEMMLNAIGDSLSHLATSDDEQDGEDKEDDEEDTACGKLSDDEPGWVMGTISKTLPHRMESFRQKQIRLDELTQPAWGGAVTYCQEKYLNYGTAELKVPADINYQIDPIAATPSPTTLGEYMPPLEIVSGQSQMPAVTSRPGSINMTLGSEKPQSHQFILLFSPVTEPNSILIVDTKFI